MFLVVMAMKIKVFFSRVQRGVMEVLQRCWTVVQRMVDTYK